MLFFVSNLSLAFPEGDGYNNNKYIVDHSRRLDNHFFGKTQKKYGQTGVHLPKGGRAVAVAGIIAEYNPFHRGHAWQIAEIRRRLGVKEIYINYVGPVIGSHTGAGVVTLFFVGRER